jgi:hypothetical protein
VPTAPAPLAAVSGPDGSRLAPGGSLPTQEQAVVDAIERQYAETYRRLAGKGVSDGSSTSARHSADTFEPAPAPASTPRASLHAQAAAHTSIRATITDILAPDSTQYPRWRD